MNRKDALQRRNEEQLLLEKRREVAGKWLEARREKQGLRQQDVARMVGVLPASVSSIELGRNSMPIKRYAAWADALGVNRRQFAKHMTATIYPDLFALLFPDHRKES